MYTKEYMFMDMCMHMYACVRRGGGGVLPPAGQIPVGAR
jgi:hypothetical protein